MYDLETQALALDTFRYTYGVKARPEDLPDAWSLCLEVAHETLAQEQEEDE